MEESLTKCNLAFIDGQNLHLGTTKCQVCAKRKNIEFRRFKISDCDCGFAWKVDLFKFRRFLSDKYHVTKAYYFLGFLDDNNQSLYKDLGKAGFKVIFRAHSKSMSGNKKGNVDTDIVFEMMRNVLENKRLGKIVLVSGDGDYYKTIKFLDRKGYFLHILFPNGRTASSLYNDISSKNKTSLNRVRKKIEYKKKKGHC